MSKTSELLKNVKCPRCGSRTRLHGDGYGKVKVACGRKRCAVQGPSRVHFKTAVEAFREIGKPHAAVLLNIARRLLRYWKRQEDGFYFAAGHMRPEVFERLEAEIKESGE